MSKTWDVAIIGGGIVGTATAMALACRPRKPDIIVLEAETKLAAHQTGNNSGVIHSGLYYKPGSLKARNCVEGREAMYRFCEEHGIPHDRCGKLVVATSPAQMPALEELDRRGRANGLKGLRRLEADELKEYEPAVVGIAGLHVDETGIVDYTAVTNAFAGIVREAGGEIRTGARVTAARRQGGTLVLETTAGAVQARTLINCAGLQSDRVATLCGVEPGVKIIPFRGEYYELVGERATLVRNLVYPVPDPRFPFLGVHFTRTIHGEVEAGPNAVFALAREGYGWTRVRPAELLGTLRFGGFWTMARKYWRTGVYEMYRSLNKQAFTRALQRLVPDVRAEDIHRGGAGVRAQAVAADGSLVDDFRIVADQDAIHVLNAPSPAATASLSIGRHVASLAVQTFALT